MIKHEDNKRDVRKSLRIANQRQKQTRELGLKYNDFKNNNPSRLLKNDSAIKKKRLSKLIRQTKDIKNNKKRSSVLKEENIKTSKANPTESSQDILTPSTLPSSQPPFTIRTSFPIKQYPLQFQSLPWQHPTSINNVHRPVAVYPCFPVNLPSPYHYNQPMVTQEHCIEHYQKLSEQKNNIKPEKNITGNMENTFLQYQRIMKCQGNTNSTTELPDNMIIDEQPTDEDLSTAEFFKKYQERWELLMDICISDPKTFVMPDIHILRDEHGIYAVLIPLLEAIYC